MPRRAFGHFGFGGSGAWADPRRNLAVGADRQQRPRHARSAICASSRSAGRRSPAPITASGAPAVGPANAIRPMSPANATSPSCVARRPSGGADAARRPDPSAYRCAKTSTGRVRSWVRVRAHLARAVPVAHATAGKSIRQPRRRLDSLGHEESIWRLSDWRARGSGTAGDDDASDARDGDGDGAAAAAAGGERASTGR